MCIRDSSLDVSVFEIYATLYKQVQGSAIGNPASPTICNIVTAHEEYCWAQCYRDLVHNQAFFRTRYVDNRLMFIPNTLQEHRGILELCDLDFYREPITLETVHDFHFLGFNLDTQQKSLKYIMQDETWRYRSAASAGSQTLAVSGYTARLHIIYRDSRPRSAARSSASHLTAIYRQNGFSEKLLLSLHRRVALKHLRGT